MFDFVSMPGDTRSWSALQGKGFAAFHGGFLRGLSTGAFYDGQACPVSKRAILPSSPTVKLHRVRISPHASLE